MRRAPLLVVAAVVLTLATTSYAAPERNLDEARVHFGRGVQLYREGDFRAALAEFNRANDLGPSYRILFNIGQAQIELRDYPGAMKTFARYLSEGGSEIETDKRDEIAKVIATCSERVAEVTVHVNRADAELFLDDVSIGRGPLGEPLVVGSGRRKLAAVVDGLPPVVRVIEVTGGDRVTVELSLDEPPARAEAPPIVVLRIPTAPPRASPSHAPFWISLVVTGTLGAATLTSGVVALGARHRLDTELDKLPVDDGRTASARTSVKTASLATDILGAATFVGLGVTTYFVLTTLRAGNSAPSVHVGVGPGTIAAGGQF